MLARMILPWFGGTAAVWATCLLFFESVLVAGYLYAHWSIERLGPRAHAGLHTALLAAAAVLLPVVPSAAWKPSGVEDPALRILALLVVAAGLPCLLLSATSPLAQAWYNRTDKSGRPYRLYAVSNLACMAALLSYPVLVEPYFGVRAQTAAWSAGFVLFAVLSTLAAVRSAAPPKLIRDPDGRKPNRRPGLRAHLVWLGLAACPSVLLLGLTNELTQNIAPAPFLWIMPLSVYLLSFILCFGRPRTYRRDAYLGILAGALPAMALAIMAREGNTDPRIAAPLFSAGLFVACMFCNGELVARKPDPAFLTSFYLMISTGGALGGVFVALIAPRLFAGYFELPLALVATAMSALAISTRVSIRTAGMWAAICLIVLAVAFMSISTYAAGSRFAGRNFYGAILVKDEPNAAIGGPVRVLMNGTIQHGSEVLSTRDHPKPTMYYGPESGAAVAIRTTRHSAQRIGVIGLGAGTLAAYAQPGDDYRFYEVNPLVVSVARSQFDFLRACNGRADVVLGDARLSLERDAPQNFDALVVDAFSSDSIPVHLLTREAFALYFRQLAPNGILAVHITNRFLDLAPVVITGTAPFGATAARVETYADPQDAISRSDWILAGREKGWIERANLTPIHAPRGFRAWTDDYSNLLRVLK